MIEGLPASKLAHFFTHTRHGYQVSDELRSMCTFSKQDILKDPPYSRIDLLSCRNFFIYLLPEDTPTSTETI